MPVWFSDASCFDALLTPAAERYVSASTVIFNLGGGWLARVWQDLVVGSTLVIFFALIDVSSFDWSCAALIVSRSCEARAVIVVAKDVLKIFRTDLSFHTAVGREDHLTLSCWWRSYALTVVD